jgi:hypothetical protein
MAVDSLSVENRSRFPKGMTARKAKATTTPECRKAVAREVRGLAVRSRGRENQV